MDNFNYLPIKINELNRINNTRIYIGVPYKDDFLTMIALVQEYGTQITPKTSKYLCIPTNGANGKRPGEIPGLYKRGMTLGVNDKTQSNGYRVCFILKTSVKIPSRPFIRNTVSHYMSDWTALIQNNVQRVLNDRNFNADEFFDVVGKQMVSDMQTVMKQLMVPHNAPLTIANKGKDDPLIDTGKLMNSIQMILERKL